MSKQVGVEVDRGCGSAVWDGVGSDGCGEVDVTAELDVAKTGGGFGLTRVILCGVGSGISWWG